MELDFEGQETGLSMIEMQYIRNISEKYGVEIRKLLDAIFGDIVDFIQNILIDIVFNRKLSHQTSCKQIYHFELVAKKIIPKARSNCSAYLAPP